jgi:hypothetical protein
MQIKMQQLSHMHNNVHKKGKYVMRLGYLLTTYMLTKRRIYLKTLKKQKKSHQHCIYRKYYVMYIEQILYDCKNLMVRTVPGHDGAVSKLSDWLKYAHALYDWFSRFP